MPANVRRVAFLTAPLHPPELLPGLKHDHEFRFGVWLDIAKRDFGKPDFTEKILACFAFIITPIWFLPGWAYRFILKSTLWLWWILFIIGGAPKVDGGIDGLKADAYRKFYSWALLVSAAFTITGFAFGNVLKPLLLNHLSDAPLPAVVASLFLIDWRAISGFQIVSLLAAGLAVAVLFWTNSLAVDSGVKGREQVVKSQFPWLVHTVRLKQGFGALSIALIMVYIAFYANAVHGWLPVSDFLHAKLEWIYGVNAKALRQTL